LRVAADGFVDTGYPCLPDSPTLQVTGPPPGTVSVGGYRFVLRELQDTVTQTGSGEATLAALPDALAGHRLAGAAADGEALREALVTLGANPLLVGAFRKPPSQAA
jgi:hypothetical protein